MANKHSESNGKILLVDDDPGLLRLLSIRLRAENTRATTTEEAAVEAAMARRMAHLEAENRRLRQSLADAESKLDALSAIERSLREQSSNGETP